MKRFHSPSGFTLPEAIVALAISGLLFVVVVEMMISTTRLQDFITEQSTAITTAQTALNPVAKVVREAAPAANGNYSISAASDNSLTVYTDIDNDDLTDQITYSLSGSNFIQTTIKPTGSPATYPSASATTKTIARGVVNATLTNNPVFIYYDTNYPIDVTNNPLTNPIDVTKITLIKIQLDINVDPAHLPNTSRITTYIQLRNLKSNL